MLLERELKMFSGAIYSAVLLSGIANQPNITVDVHNVSTTSYQYVVPYVGVAGTKAVIVSRKGITSNTPNYPASVLAWNSVSSNASLLETTIEPPGVLLFNLLMREWKQETSGYSSIDKKINHPSYRKIIKIGPEVITLILKELKREPGHWFAALRELTTDNPVQIQHRGNIAEMANDWLRWGRDKNQLG
jgi:hypothetical protein